MARFAVVAALALLTGCSVTGFEDSHRVPDAEIQDLVSRAPYPELLPSSVATAPANITVGPDGRRSIKLSLVEGLRLAVRNNQGFLSSTEALDLQLLSLHIVRHGWTTTWSPLTGSVTFSDSPGSTATGSQSLAAGLNQKLPFGGTASIGVTKSGSQVNGPNTYGSGASASLTIPLLKGSGSRAAIEELIGAERSYAYATRTYNYNRMELLVQTVQSFFGQLQQEKNIVNFERNLERARTLLRQSETQFRFGRVTRTDVFRAQLQVTGAENALSNAREQINQSRDAFKLDLGLKPEDELLLVDETIEYKPLEMGATEATALALENNPQWLNSRDAFEDSRRALALARNGNLNQFDITGSYSWTGESQDRPFEDPLETGSRSWSVTGSFSIPLDRLSLKRDYQAAVLAYKQSERNFDRARDGIVRETQSRVVQIRQAETTLTLQKRAITEAERAARLVQLDYDRGRVRNREVIDAQDRLLEAQNQYQTALVQTKISQLRLLQWVGKLVIDDEGKWLK